MFSYIAAGWSVLDAAYMVVITIFGIGYGEVQPISDPMLKIQTMSLIIVGCLSGLYSCGGFIQLLTEGEINRALGAQRMTRGIRKMKSHAIICGFGRVGQLLALQLKEEGTPCVIIDNKASRLEEAKSLGLSVIHGDASTDETLKQAGIARARTLASVLPNDAINVFITLTARDLNSEIEILARAECPSTEYKLLRSGADHVVMPAAIGALRMAEIIKSLPPTTVRSSKKSDLKVLKVAVADSVELEAETLAIAQNALRDVGNVIGVQRGGTELITEMDDQMALASEDVLLVAQVNSSNAS